MSSVSIVLASQAFACVISFYPLQSICYLPFPPYFLLLYSALWNSKLFLLFTRHVPRFRAAQSRCLPIMLLESYLGVSPHPCLAHYLCYCTELPTSSLTFVSAN